MHLPEPVERIKSGRWRSGRSRCTGACGRSPRDARRPKVRRCVVGGIEARLTRDGGGDPLSDYVVGVVAIRVGRAARTVTGAAWRLFEGHADEIKVWVDDDGLPVGVE